VPGSTDLAHPPGSKGISRQYINIIIAVWIVFHY
jgi:hypothetical protein